MKDYSCSVYSSLSVTVMLMLTELTSTSDDKRIEYCQKVRKYCR